MWYQDNVNASSFQNTSFQPIFTTTFTADEELHVQQLCGDNANCRLDYAATGNEAVANTTHATSETNTRTSSFVGECLKSQWHTKPDEPSVILLLTSSHIVINLHVHVLLSLFSFICFITKTLVTKLMTEPARLAISCKQ